MKNPFKLPSPVDLGLAKTNALELRSFTPWSKNVCWEDYDAILKEKFPVRFFLLKTVVHFIKYKIYFRIARPLSDAWYWFKSHTFPGSKYHLLDLRQPCGDKDLINIDCYRYGWNDVPEKMLYAIFNLLKEYFDEEPFDLTTKYSREEIEADESMKSQQHYYDEAKAILHWWQVERKQDAIKIDQLRETWSHARKDDISPDDSETKWHWLQLRYADEEFEKKTDEMIARLMKIRRGLWT